MTTKPRKIRALRHWKQQYDPHARFVWRKAMGWSSPKGEIYHTVPGDFIPAELAAAPAKLRRFWEAGVIELAEFEADENILTPAPQPTSNRRFDAHRDLDLPPLVWVKQGGGLSFTIQVGDQDTYERVGNRAELEARIETLRSEMAELLDPEQASPDLWHVAEMEAEQTTESGTEPLSVAEPDQTTESGTEPLSVAEPDQTMDKDVRVQPVTDDEEDLGSGPSAFSGGDEDEEDWLE